MVLIVEDDQVQNDVLANFLQHDGIETKSAYSLAEAQNIFDDRVKLVVLDLGLPDGSGLDFLKMIREKSRIPVIVLTAQNDEFTQLNAFGLEADEFIDKPFSPLVMTKRIKAWLKRIYPENSIVKLKDFWVDFFNYRVTNILGEEIILTSTEFKILRILFHNKDRVVTREALIESVWGSEYRYDIRILDSHIKNLRKKLVSEIIITVKGVGYRISM